MAEGANETVSTDFVAHDKATGVIGKIAGAAQQAAGAVGRMLDTMGAMAGIGALFAVGEAVHEINGMYDAVGRVKAVTGLAAQDSYAMLTGFKLAGIEVGSAERILTRMARKTEQVGDGMGAGAKNTSALYKRLGIDIKSGPEAQMLAMAKAAEEHKVNVVDLGLAWNVPVGQAGAMLKMLQKGPDEFKKTMDAARKSGGVIDEAALTSYGAMKQAKRDMGEAWENLVGTLYKAVIPAFTKIMTTVAAALEKWEPTIKKVAAFLLSHMEQIVSLAGKFAKLMVVHKLAGALGFGGVGGLATKGYDGGLGGMGSILKVIGKFSLLGIALLAIVGVVAYVKKHWDTLGPKIMAVVGHIVSVFRRLWEALEPIAEWVGDKLVKVFLWLADAIADVASAIMDAVNWIVEAVKYVGRMIALGWEALKNPTQIGEIFKRGVAAEIVYAQDQANAKAIKSWDDAIAKANKQVAGVLGKKGDGTPDGRPPGTTNDFRGSHFDIRQNFAEGFDPDRVAAAFSSDLAKLGDRKVQSGLSPLYAAGLR